MHAHVRVSDHICRDKGRETAALCIGGTVWPVQDGDQVDPQWFHGGLAGTSSSLGTYAADFYGGRVAEPPSPCPASSPFRFHSTLAAPTPPRSTNVASIVPGQFASRRGIISPHCHRLIESGTERIVRTNRSNMFREAA